MSAINLTYPQNPPDATAGNLPSAPEFKWGEIDWSTGTQPGTNAINITQSAISFGVARQLTKRRLYLWLYGTGSVSTNFFINGRIGFWTAGGQTLVGSVPVCVGALAGAGTSVSAASLPSLVNSGGIVAPNTLGLLIANYQGVQPLNVILQPLEVNTNCDTITLDLTSAVNATGMRAWLGCVSQPVK